MYLTKKQEGDLRALAGIGPYVDGQMVDGDQKVRDEMQKQFEEPKKGS